MKKTESYVLYHGTIEPYAEQIRLNGFMPSGAEGNWCGSGIYFYDIKSKAWWAAIRKAHEVKKESGRFYPTHIIKVEINNLETQYICDLRSPRLMREFGAFLDEMEESARSKIDVKIDGSELSKEDKIILIRGWLIEFFIQVKQYKLVIGYFKQRENENVKQISEFASGMDMYIGIETIYCVKDSSVIQIT